MQWHKAWWYDKNKPGCWGQPSLAQGMTRAKNEKAARAKIDAVIGHSVDGIKLTSGDSLNHCRRNK